VRARARTAHVRLCNLEAALYTRAIMNACRSFSRRRRVALPALLAIGLLLGGCSQDFTISIRDQDREPIAGVLVYRASPSDTTEFGATDESGTLIIPRKRLKAYDALRFRKDLDPLQTVRFSQYECAMQYLEARRYYSFNEAEAIVHHENLSGKKPDLKGPGLQLDMTLVEDKAVRVHHLETQERFLRLTRAQGVNVKLLGENIALVPGDAPFTIEFCPGDSAECVAPEVTFEFVREDFGSVAHTAPLPAPLDTIRIDLLRDVTLNLQGRCRLDTQTLPFGRVKLDTSSVKTFRITNRGLGELEGDVASDNPVFRITSGGGPFRLAANQSRQVTVVYSPVEARKDDGRITLSTACGSVLCRGEGFRPGGVQDGDCEVRVTSVPVGCDVHFNGVKMDYRTNYTYWIAPGSYEVTIVAPGRVPLKHEITAALGKPVAVTCNFDTREISVK
jgi:hypothetical protein